MSELRSGRTAGGVALVLAVALGVGWAADVDPTALSLRESRTAEFADAPPYDRGAFGDGWAPAGPGCDVRDTILARDLDEVTLSDGCDVLAGRLQDPYSGIVFAGPTRGLDVDHVVPLAHAWDLGAWAWTPGERGRFANDPTNLQATLARVNRAKGDSGLGEWLPDRDPCSYARRFDEVADAYGLEDPARDGQVAQACD